MSFFQATSDTLPIVSFEMILDYLEGSESFSSAEYRGSKAARSARPDYGDKAIGFVELKRDGSLCCVKARITPEHRVRTKPYSVSAFVDENSGIITDAQCHDCTSSEGGCKHAIALLFWLHRRTEEPAPTEAVCYWKKSALSTVGSRQSISLREFSGSRAVVLPEKGSSFLEEVTTFCETNSIVNMIHINHSNSVELLQQVSLHYLIMAYRSTHNVLDYTTFLNYCTNNISNEIMAKIRTETMAQSASKLWFELRYGRITASIIYAASRTKTSDGSLVEKILGACRPIETGHMKRGKKLETQVLKVVEDHLNTKLQQSGLLLKADIPHFGASPDAIGEDFVVEVKCPKNINKYIVNGKIAACFEAQLQLQMMFQGVSKGLFALADPSFETNQIVHLYWIDFNEAWTKDLIEKASEFWKNAIFPKLISISEV